MLTACIGLVVRSPLVNEACRLIRVDYTAIKLIPPSSNTCLGNLLYEIKLNKPDKRSHMLSFYIS